MILVVFGTTGELIKLAPVLLRLDERGHPYLLATTGSRCSRSPGSWSSSVCGSPISGSRAGQRARSPCDLRHSALGRHGRTLVVARTRNVRRACVTAGAPAAPRSRGHDDDGAGSLIGRSMRSRSRNQGGLRSNDLRHPFPEELNRRSRRRSAGSTTRRVPGPLRTCAAVRSSTRARTRFETASSSCPTSHRPWLPDVRSASSRSIGSSSSTTAGCSRRRSKCSRTPHTGPRCCSSTIR